MAARHALGARCTDMPCAGGVKRVTAGLLSKISDACGVPAGYAASLVESQPNAVISADAVLRSLALSTPRQ